MDAIHVTVAAIIRRKEQFLLVKEQASTGQVVFNQAAGHVELRESLLDAVVREVLEETGLSFTPEALVGVYLISPATNGKTYLRFCFCGEVPANQIPEPQDSDIIDTQWFSKDEIFQLPKESLRSALVLQCLSDYLEGKRLPLESLVFSNDEHQLAEQCLRNLVQ